MIQHTPSTRANKETVNPSTVTPIRNDSHHWGLSWRHAKRVAFVPGRETKTDQRKSKNPERPQVDDCLKKARFPSALAHTHTRNNKGRQDEKNRKTALNTMSATMDTRLLQKLSQKSWVHAEMEHKGKTLHYWLIETPRLPFKICSLKLAGTQDSSTVKFDDSKRLRLWTVSNAEAFMNKIIDECAIFSGNTRKSYRLSEEWSMWKRETPPRAVSGLVDAWRNTAINTGLINRMDRHVRVNDWIQPMAIA